MGKGEGKVGWRKEQVKFEKDDERKLKMGGNGRRRASKGICCCDRKVVISEFSFFLLPNKTEWALVYSPEALCLHSADICPHCTL